MKIYLDTSSLIKLYHTESGTSELDNLFEDNTIQEIFLSEITKIEFNSAICKKVRTKDLTNEEATELISSFTSDYGNYSFVDSNNDLILHAKDLVTKHGVQGLRTLDSIQLASALKVYDQVELFLTSDKLLSELFKDEGLRTK
jgi:predicted nucleic acid-binding protein